MSPEWDLSFTMNLTSNAAINKNSGVTHLQDAAWNILINMWVTGKTRSTNYLLKEIELKDVCNLLSRSIPL